MKPPNDLRKIIKEVIAGPAAIIVLLAFFMPWVTVSCEGSGINETVSGYDLTRDQSEEGVEQNGDAALYLIPLVALITLGVVWMRYSGSLAQLLAARLYMALGAVGLIVQFLKYLSLRSDLNDAEREFGEGVINLSYRYGWWLTALALIAIVVAGFIKEEHVFGEEIKPSPLPPETPARSSPGA